LSLTLSFSQFKIGVLLKDLNLETELRAKLQNRGFQTVLYNQKSLEANVVVLDVEALIEPMSDLIEKALEVNSETKFVILCPHDHVETVSQYRDYNAYEIIVNTESNRVDKLFWAVENASTELYFYYQNIQMAHQLKSSKNDLSEALRLADQMKISSLDEAQEKPQQSLAEIRDIKHLSLIRELRKIEDFNETANYFLTQAPHRQKIYFSLNKKTNVFHCAYVGGFALSSVKDLQYQSNDSEIRNLMGLNFSILPENFEKFILQLFGSPHFKLFPIIFFNQILGFFAFLTTDGGDDQENELYYTDLIWPVVSLQLEAFCSRVRVNDLEIRDHSTRFYNGKYYEVKVREEFQRALRLQHPLSLVRFQFDDYGQMKKDLGEVNLRMKLNLISEIILSTGRAHDISCLLSENSFVLILPHCGRKYAAVRAERLRKSIEAHPDIKGTFKVGISFGVSEFPSLCSKVEDLEQSALKALNYILTKGGNKVCIYRAPQDYNPPFAIQAET
jgi:diguanylate cyclase (GGDEF)-like protein